MATLIFPHQLYRHHPAVSEGRQVILVEEFLYFSHYRFHKQKLVLHRASMKAYAAMLEKEKHPVQYIEAAAPHSDVRRLGTWLKQQQVTCVHLAAVSDDWLHRRLLQSLDAAGIEVVWYASPNFLTDQPDFDAYAAGRKGYFQTDFYIWQRKRLKILLEQDGSPAGGKWSFDAENRSPFPKGETVPAMPFPARSPFVTEALAYVEEHWPGNYGDAENFHYPITHAQAVHWLNDFLAHRFEKFGVYEDAIVAGEHYLYHSVLTPMLNIGLLEPQQILQATLKVHREKKIPLNSAEGFIRQLIGWREFIHGVYNREGRRQRTRHFWHFHRPVPRMFWTGDTGVLPVDTVIRKVLQTGYSHHIERLMIMGNFMLLCEFDPDEVYRWFMEMYVDAYDWVMVPNTYGMTQFSDGGLMMTKPYISGSNYLMKMGDWKHFEKALSSGQVALFEQETPPLLQKEDGPTWQQIWDGLFWRFMQVHRDFFSGNPRMGLLLKSFDKMSREKQQAHLDQAVWFLKKLDEANEKEAPGKKGVPDGR